MMMKYISDLNSKIHDLISLPFAHNRDRGEPHDSPPPTFTRLRRATPVTPGSSTGIRITYHGGPRFAEATTGQVG
jgi:hypothetical protein